MLRQLLNCHMIQFSQVLVQDAELAIVILDGWRSINLFLEVFNVLLLKILLEIFFRPTFLMKSFHKVVFKMLHSLLLPCLGLLLFINIVDNHPQAMTLLLELQCHFRISLVLIVNVDLVLENHVLELLELFLNFFDILLIYGQLVCWQALFLGKFEFIKLWCNSLFEDI